MTGHIVLFPATARLGEVERIASNMLGMAPDAAEAFLVRYLLGTLQRLTALGVASQAINTDLAAFEGAVRATLWRRALSSGHR